MRVGEIKCSNKQISGPSSDEIVFLTHMQHLNTYFCKLTLYIALWWLLICLFIVVSGVCYCTCFDVYYFKTTSTAVVFLTWIMIMNICIIIHSPPLLPSRPLPPPWKHPTRQVTCYHLVVLAITLCNLGILPVAA